MTVGLQSFFLVPFPFACTKKKIFHSKPHKQYLVFCHTNDRNAYLIVSASLQYKIIKLLQRPFDKLGMTRGQGQWPRVTGITGWNQCALLFQESVGDILHWLTTLTQLCTLDFLPFLFQVFFFLFNLGQVDYTDMKGTFYYFTLYAAFSNFTLNPIIYSVQYKQFQVSFIISLLDICFHKTKGGFGAAKGAKRTHYFHSGGSSWFHFSSSWGVDGS